jgi:Putative Ig domain
MTQFLSARVQVVIIVWCSCASEICMQQMIKSFLCVGGLLIGLQSAWGFALLGPIANGGDQPWQLQEIGYGVDGDNGAPKNIGEEYRRNTPVLYYTYDQNFLDYFGSNGVAAVDSAFAILNNAFTNNPTGVTNGLDGYSASLSEFPQESQTINYQAQALGLLDLKSEALVMMMEQLGLAEPERFVWTLHQRYLPPGGQCPANEEYLVVQRNFDIINSPLNQIQYSSYINGTLYSYFIVELCTAPIDPQAVTVPFSPDPFANTYTAVAGRGDGLYLGGFYTGLTRDDVGGLRYLFTTNNVNWESPAAGSLLISSSGGGAGGLSPPFPLWTSNYTTLVQAALTNSPAVMSNLFPGLVIASSTPYFVMVTNPIIVAYYTNSFVYGDPPMLIVATNGYTGTVATNYITTFANVIITTNSYHTNTSADLITIEVVPNFSYGNTGLTTNTHTTHITLTNVPSADYYILTNSCGPNVLVSTLWTNVERTTNLLVTASNAAGYFYSKSLVTYSTNHILIMESQICGSSGSTVAVTNGPGLYQGIKKIQFVRADYDSLIGRYWKPVTNTYTMIYITNDQPVVQTFQRLVTAPDILFSAQDEASPIPPEIFGDPVLKRTPPAWNQSSILTGLAGPGTIDPIPTATITFNKVGDIYENGSLAADGLATNQFLYEINQSKLWAWGSFDGTTNDPVVYPNGTSIQNLENQILIQLSIMPTSDVDYTTNPPALTYDTNMTFSATGGAFTPPFTWSATGLPSGLTMTTTNSVGTFSGTPTQSGPFDFTLRLTDYNARSVQWPFSITIP